MREQYRTPGGYTEIQKRLLGSSPPSTSSQHLQGYRENAARGTYRFDMSIRAALRRDVSAANLTSGWPVRGPTRPLQHMAFMLPTGQELCHQDADPWAGPYESVRLTNGYPSRLDELQRAVVCWNQGCGGSGQPYSARLYVLYSVPSRPAKYTRKR